MSAPDTLQPPSRQPSPKAGWLAQFLRYTGVGGVSAIGHYGLLTALVEWRQADPVVASGAGALLGALINYALNYRYTFRSRQRHVAALWRFGVVATSGLGLNTLLMWLAVDRGGLHYLVAQLMTTAIVLVWNFLFNRRWTFGARA